MFDHVQQHGYENDVSIVITSHDALKMVKKIVEITKSWENICNDNTITV